MPKHKPSEHLFIINSVVEFYKTQGKGLILTSFDIRTMFDSENIYDCMKELYNSNVK